LSRASSAGKDQEQFGTRSFHGDQAQSRGAGQPFDPRAASQGGRVSPAENSGTDREVGFLDKAGPEKGGVEFAAALAEQARHAPLSFQPAQGGGKVKFAASEDFDFVGQRAQAAQAGRGDAGGGENEDRGEAALEDFGAGSMVPVPLTMTRRLYSARPRWRRRRRYLAGPAPG